LDPVTPSNRLGTLADDLHINASTWSNVCNVSYT
jgi:hypothetical protein